MYTMTWKKKKINNMLSTLLYICTCNSYYLRYSKLYWICIVGNETGINRSSKYWFGLAWISRSYEIVKLVIGKTLITCFEWIKRNLVGRIILQTHISNIMCDLPHTFSWLRLIFKLFHRTIVFVNCYVITFCF